MLQNFLHWAAIAAQLGNAALSIQGVFPPKVAMGIAGGVALLQYVTHLLDPKAASIGAGSGGPG